MNLLKLLLNLSQPKVAILREQGVNGQLEMAAAFDRVGFETYDVHMSDLLAGRVRLDDFQGLVACGGFSYGDVLGAGGGGQNLLCIMQNFVISLRVSFIIVKRLRLVFVMVVKCYRS